MYVTNKVVIITGGIRGIGLAIVQHLLKNEAKYVAIFDVPSSHNADVIFALNKIKRNFNVLRFGYYKCNVANIDEFTACYEEVNKTKSYVDILINNASVCDDDEIDLTLDVNVKAVIKTTLHAIEHMRHFGGTVLNIASFLGLVNRPMSPVYITSKHAVVAFVRSMKEHDETYGVRILCICPGMTRKRMTTWEDADENIADYITQEVIKSYPRPYLHDPDNIAFAVIEILETGKQGDIA